MFWNQGALTYLASEQTYHPYTGPTGVPITLDLGMHTIPGTPVERDFQILEIDPVDFNPVSVGGSGTPMPITFISTSGGVVVTQVNPTTIRVAADPAVTEWLNL